MCSVAENSGEERLVDVDPQFERNSPSKLVSFVSCRNVVGVDLALDVHVFVGSDVKELNGDQRLRVVDLQSEIKRHYCHTFFKKKLCFLYYCITLLLWCFPKENINKCTYTYSI